MSNEETKHRSHLPMPNTDRVGRITFDAKDPDTQNPPIEQLRPPKGAPNVLIINLRRNHPPVLGAIPPFARLHLRAPFLQVIQ